MKSLKGADDTDAGLSGRFRSNVDTVVVISGLILVIGNGDTVVVDSSLILVSKYQKVGGVV